MQDRWSHFNIQNQIEAMFPWFKNPRRLVESSHVFEIEGGEVVKLVSKARPPVGISHEAHTLQCLARANVPGLIVPQFTAVDPILDETSPFEHVIRMTKIDGQMPICDNKKSDDVLVGIGKATGILHQAFKKIQGSLRERQYYTIEDETIKRKYALDFARLHLSDVQMEKLSRAFMVAAHPVGSPVFVHGDLYPRNVIVGKHDVGLIDLEYMIKTENPEREFLSFQPSDYSLLCEGYQQGAGVALDPRLMATHFLVKEARVFAYPNEKLYLSENKTKLQKALDRPYEVFGAYTPYGLEG